MKKFKLLILSLVVMLTANIGASLMSVQYVDAQAKDAVCDSIGGCTPAPGEASITDTIRSFLNILSLLAGVATVVMMMIAGFKFITSQGDSGAISSARNTALYALVGMVIVLFSQLIVRFVLTSTTSTPAPTTTTCVPTATNICRS